MLFTVVTTETGKGRHLLGLTFKEFFIDLIRHLHHGAGNIFMLILITGKIEPLAIRTPYMAVVTLYSQRFRKVLHDTVHFRLGGIAGQHLQILIKRFLINKGKGGEHRRHNDPESK